MIRAQKNDKGVQQLILSMVASYRSLRHWLIIVALTFLSLLLVYRYHGDDTIFRNSISAYYHNQGRIFNHMPVRDLFVGTFVSVAFMLIAYKGYTRKESWLLNVAAGGLLVVAICPMDWTQPAVVAEDVAFSLRQSDRRAEFIDRLEIPQEPKNKANALRKSIGESETSASDLARSLEGVEPKNDLPLTLSGKLHYTGAIVFFVGIALVCWFRASDTLKDLFQERPELFKLYRSLYRLTGALMGLVPVLAIGLYVGGLRSTVFWVEFAGVAVFILYWAIKSLELSNVEIEGTPIKGM